MVIQLNNPLISIVLRQLDKFNEHQIKLINLLIRSINLIVNLIVNLGYVNAIDTCKS